MRSHAVEREFLESMANLSGWESISENETSFPGIRFLERCAASSEATVQPDVESRRSKTNRRMGDVGNLLGKCHETSMVRPAIEPVRHRPWSHCREWMRSDSNQL